VSYRLTDEAVEGIDALAQRSHVTTTALLEALGTLGAKENPTLDEIIAEARRIDVERRSRR
jgi:hypothetical protein